MAVFKLSQAVATVLASSLTIMGSAKAADLSFSGTLSDSNPVQFLGFTLSTESTVSVRTFSYAGGTQANGNTVSAGGFDPIITLFDTRTSPAIVFAVNDDGGSFVPADPTTGFSFDSFLQQSLTPGNYAIAISTYPNFSPFRSDYTPNGRTGNWALDILNVDVANPIDPVPVAMHGI